MRPLRSLIPFLIPALLACALPAAAQVAVVEPQNVDLGKMKQNEVKETTVTVSNAGAGLLVIKEVKADCGCTVAELEKEQLGPGEKTQLNITFESKKFYGVNHKAIHLYTNDPKQPKITVVLTVDIHAPLIVEPRGVKFENTKRGDTPTEVANFKATDIPELRLSAKETERGLFDFEIVHDVDGDPQAAQVRFTIPADAQVGRLQDFLRVTTNVPEEPYVDLRIQTFIGLPITAYPEQVNFRYKKAFRREVRIFPFERDGTPFEITKIEVDVPGVEAKLTSMRPNIEGVVRLTGHAIAKTDPRAIEADGKISGKLYVYTTNPDVPVVEVPVSYMIRM